MSGGAGGYTCGTIFVSVPSTLLIHAGGGGAMANAGHRSDKPGGWPTGGSGSDGAPGGFHNGGSGGGGSYIYVLPDETDGKQTADHSGAVVQLVAGGGGG